MRSPAASFRILEKIFTSDSSSSMAGFTARTFCIFLENFMLTMSFMTKRHISVKCLSTSPERRCGLSSQRWNPVRSSALRSSGLPILSPMCQMT